MEQATLPRRLHWTDFDLYRLLMESFPDYRTRQQGVLDVQRLRTEIEVSHEGFYKWLRAGKLTPRNARKLVALANQKPNIAALANLGRHPPTFEDFTKFFG